MLSGLQYSGSNELISPSGRGFLQSQTVMSNACNFENKSVSSMKVRYLVRILNNNDLLVSISPRFLRRSSEVVWSCVGWWDGY